MRAPAELFSQLSPAFRALLGSDMREKRDHCVDFPDVETDVFIALYEFAFTGDYSAPPPDSIDEQGHLNAGFEADEDDSPGYDQLTVGASREKHIRTRSTRGRLENTWDPAKASHRMSRESTEMLRIQTALSGLPTRRLSRDLEDQFYGIEQPVPWYLEDLMSSHREQFYRQSFAMPKSTLNYNPCETNVMLHARLYCLAEEYLIEPLQDLCLGRLHGYLQYLELTDTTIPGVLNLAAFAYSMTGRQSFRGENGLRKLVCLYVAAYYMSFWGDKRLHALLDIQGELGSDLLGLLCM